MKNLSKNLILGLAVLSAGNTWAQSLSDTSREINAQTTIVKSAVDNVIKKLDRKQVDTKFRANDYWKMQPAFRTEVDYALTDFENEVTKEIMPKVRFHLDQYNSIFHSTEFSNEQKQLMLQERYKRMENEFIGLSKQYQLAIGKVYKLLPEYPISYDVQDSNNGNYEKVTPLFKGKKENVEVYWRDYHDAFYANKKDAKNDDNRLGQSGHVSDSVVFPIVDTYLYKKYVYPELKSECESRICMSLRAGDLITTLSLIKNSIDRDLEFKLSDGRILKLTKLEKNTVILQKFLSITEYPEDMPFEAAN